MENIIFLVAIISLIISSATLYKVYRLEKRFAPSKEIENEDTDDGLYETAKQIAIEYQACSTSLLQRKLRIGYARAARMIDMLEENGVIEAGEGARPRKVLLPNHKKHKLVLIDDDEFLRDMYKTHFEKNGWKVLTLPHAGGDFVQTVADAKPDLISLDIVMPERDGYEALKLLKQDERTKNIPVIFACNLGQEEDILKGISSGADDYVVIAHFTPQEIVQTYTDFLVSPQTYVKRYPACIAISKSDIHKEGKNEEEKNDILNEIFEMHGINF